MLYLRYWPAPSPVRFCGILLGRIPTSEVRMANGSDKLSIDATPTKELFVEMLTRDVALIPAIIDLADNCTDGARRLRKDEKWQAFEIDIAISPDQFAIKDNCGGISVKAAPRVRLPLRTSNDGPQDSRRSRALRGRYEAGSFQAGPPL